MKTCSVYLLAVLFSLSTGRLGAQADAPNPSRPSPVTAQDAGPRDMHNGWFAGHQDHTWRQQLITLSSDIISYSIKYRACVDASHAGVCVCDEGFIGMPAPNVANWYHTGFFHIDINGEQVGSHPLTDMGVTESGVRGAFHMVWDTPDYTARVQFLLEPGADHLLSRLSWIPKPGHTVDSVKVRLTCYPSFFTASKNRQGDRTVTTPRTSIHEPASQPLEPAADTFLLYSDGVFDVAKGEGSGPCAMLFLPEQVAAGNIHVSNYPVQTRLEASGDVRELRFAFWDLSGKTNAEALAAMAACAETTQRHLREVSFRPESLMHFDPDAASTEVAKLLDDAKGDGTRLRPQAEALLTKLTTLKAQAGKGDWSAGAIFAESYPEYEALLWKLRIFALLNTP